MAGDRCSAELRQTGKPVWLGQPFADVFSSERRAIIEQTRKAPGFAPPRCGSDSGACPQPGGRREAPLRVAEKSRRPGPGAACGDDISTLEVSTNAISRWW